MSLIGYARTSTDKQELDRQLDALTAHGIDSRLIYQEKISTRKQLSERQRMIDALQLNDQVTITELYRLGRGTVDLIKTVEQIREKGAHLKSLSEPWLDTATPQGVLFFTIAAAFGQYERDSRSDLTKQGLKSARARGRIGGRPSKQNEKSDLVLLLYQEPHDTKPEKKKYTIKQIAEKTGISVTTVKRIIQNWHPQKPDEC